jgi:hypothetical protein
MNFPPCPIGPHIGLEFLWVRKSFRMDSDLKKKEKGQGYYNGMIDDCEIEAQIMGRPLLCMLHAGRYKY